MLLTGKTKQEVDEENNLKKVKEEKNTLEKYLKDTDWYITRLTEREVPIPTEVKTKRLEAINRINEIKETYELQ